MTPDAALPAAVADLLRRIALDADRSSPLVFAGRSHELARLNDIAEAVGFGSKGQTAIVDGAPGAGKTTLRDEFRNRLLATAADAHDTDRIALGIPLRPGDLDNTPLSLVKTLDQELRDMADAGPMAVANATIDVAKRALSLYTRQDAWAGTLGVDAASTLKAVLDNYVGGVFNRLGITFLLLVDEAQNLADTQQVRNNLDALHGGEFGKAKAALICFGLPNTRQRLADLGLSRLAVDHTFALAAMKNGEAAAFVNGTLDAVTHAGGESAWRSYLERRGIDAEGWRRWRSSVSHAILHQSAGFPHHLANAVRELSKILVREGVGVEPPIEKLRRACRERRREYYEQRLAPFNAHTRALAARFAGGDAAAEQVGQDAVVRALERANNAGHAVPAPEAERVVEGLVAKGLLTRTFDGDLAVALPSLASHLSEIHERGVAAGNRTALLLEAEMGRRDDA